MLTSDLAVELVGNAIRLVTLMVAVIVAPGLLVGLVVALFQAATQINEQTLSFLPRLLATLAVLVLGGHWLVQTLMDYCVATFTRAAQLVG
ncbi:flagellar biosynthetic protein FliQ [Burkholderia thailandensis]|uniref:flagellar biosynthetic protein FliQ n=1 Tax=Burkholderia thailandensis TaxID=57975 RepID=UPI00016A4171|nr:flagellar biosynthetic protein FliQ [Burkholderia thailandensis]AIP67202.1 flagellar biosynthesis protein FliQ [Burkholderia thailandensis]AOI53844.1 flagellar biosynthetic protein FliQ [Burkholderia thailandensis]MCZ2902903.1 flagellar biosynthetic protein FliQ [Burkholderia thailandensis]MDD1483537.1 flagellar biosynthetic protein FliQ [Burkholderia thailandensis]MDD1489698.1 flagellar biosynthetic protein FliQ [Burkholderia thailandensis]